MTAAFDFADQLAELTAARDALLAQLPAAEQAYKAAFHVVEVAQAHWNGVVARVNKATELSNGVLSPTLGRLLESERDKYNAAGIALSKARQHLNQLKWDLSCRAADIEQLDRLMNPPPAPIRRDFVVMRSRPQVEDTDSIILPPGLERVV